MIAACCKPPCCTVAARLCELQYTSLFAFLFMICLVSRRMASSDNWYQILGVKQDATADQVMQAYNDKVQEVSEATQANRSVCPG